MFSVHTIVDRQQTQEDEIKMSKNLLFVEVTSEKLQHILSSHKWSAFYTDNSLCKQLCKPRDWVALGDKKITLVIKFTVVTVKQSTLVEFKWSLKSCSDEL